MFYTAALFFKKTANSQKTEYKHVPKFEFAKCIMLALQNVPVGVFCNACMLHLAIACQECI